MRIFSIFDSVPSANQALTGTLNYLNFPSGHVFVVCEPKHYGKCEDHLIALGGQVFPCALENSQIGSLASHPALAGAGLTESDTTFSATKKLKSHFGWPQLDARSF